MNTLEKEHSYEMFMEPTLLEEAREQYLGLLLCRITGPKKGVILPADSMANFEDTRRTYARECGLAFGAILPSTGEVSAEELEVAISDFIVTETSLRWQTYSTYVEAAGKVLNLGEHTEDFVRADLTKKHSEVQKSWNAFVSGYGVPAVASDITVQAEFISNKIVWDTAQEQRALYGIFPRET